MYSDDMATNGQPFLQAYLPYVLRRADQALSAAFYRVLTHYGVARSEWRVLAVLEELGELTILELTEASLSPQPTVTQAVRRLEKRNLVTRATGTTDRRQRIVGITKTGSQLTRKLIDEATQLESEALSEAGDLSALIAQLGALTKSIEAVVERQMSVSDGEAI